MTPAVRVRDLTVFYGEIEAVSRVTFDVRPGTLTAIVGPNGAGKSTTMRAMLGLQKHSGTIELLGSARRDPRRVAWVPQRSAVDHDFPITVHDLVLQGRYPHLGPFGLMRAADRAAVRGALDATAMTNLSDRTIAELSGGQLQRAFVARALAQQADLLLLDEPFAGIDAANEAAIVDVLRAQRDAGRTVVVVHHDLGGVRSIFDDVVLLNRRCIAFGPVDAAFNVANLRATYGERITVLEEPGGTGLIVS